MIRKVFLQLHHAWRDLKIKRFGESAEFTCPHCKKMVRLYAYQYDGDSDSLHLEIGKNFTELQKVKQ